jgi:hypothetical protein
MKNASGGMIIRQRDHTASFDGSSDACERPLGAGPRFERGLAFALLRKPQSLLSTTSKRGLRRPDQQSLALQPISRSRSLIVMKSAIAADDLLHRLP